MVEVAPRYSGRLLQYGNDNRKRQKGIRTMDEETRQYLAEMMMQINNGFEKILDRMEAMRQDVDNVRGHMLYGLQENLTLSQRITKLEK